jgi:hypothetical protein
MSLLSLLYIVDQTYSHSNIAQSLEDLDLGLGKDGYLSSKESDAMGEEGEDGVKGEEGVNALQGKENLKTSLLSNSGHFNRRSRTSPKCPQKPC